MDQGEVEASVAKVPVEENKPAEDVAAADKEMTPMTDQQVAPNPESTIAAAGSQASEILIRHEENEE